MSFYSHWRKGVLAIAGLLVVAACGVVPEEAGPAAPRPAKLLTLSEGSNITKDSLPAVVRPVRETDLAFQVGGQITEWNAIEGRSFSRGDVIARIDARSFEAAVTQAEAQYTNADSEYQRALRLIAEDAISRSVVEGRKAQVEVAKAALDTARKNLSDTVLRAPFSGRVGRSNVEQFQNVSPQQPVLVLQSSAVEAVVNVPASFVLNSTRARYFNTEVEFDAAPGRRFPARFKEATGQADASSQTFEAHFNFQPSADLVVLSGMTATFYYDREKITGADASGVSVPLSAILAEGDKKYVWVVKGTDRVLERRDVKVADGVGSDLVVTEGLAVGETIVATGGAYLQSGDRVRPWND